MPDEHFLWEHLQYSLFNNQLWIIYLYEIKFDLFKKYIGSVGTSQPKRKKKQINVNIPEPLKTKRLLDANNLQIVIVTRRMSAVFNELFYKKCLFKI